MQRLTGSTAEHGANAAPLACSGQAAGQDCGIPADRRLARSLSDISNTAPGAGRRGQGGLAKGTAAPDFICAALGAGRCGQGRQSLGIGESKGRVPALAGGGNLVGGRNVKWGSVSGSLSCGGLSGGVGGLGGGGGGIGGGLRSGLGGDSQALHAPKRPLPQAAGLPPRRVGSFTVFDEGADALVTARASPPHLRPKLAPAATHTETCRGPYLRKPVLAELSASRTHFGPTLAAAPARASARVESLGSCDQSPAPAELGLGSGLVTADVSPDASFAGASGPSRHIIALEEVLPPSPTPHPLKGAAVGTCAPGESEADAWPEVDQFIGGGDAWRAMASDDPEELGSPATLARTLLGGVMHHRVDRHGQDSPLFWVQELGAYSPPRSPIRCLSPPTMPSPGSDASSPFTFLGSRDRRGRELEPLSPTLPPLSSLDLDSDEDGA